MRQPVILFVSDGESHPPLSSSARQAMMDKAEAFKASGGIILCVGLRASGEGFSLLQDLASGGFFINVLGDQDPRIAAAQLRSLMAYYCASQNPIPDEYRNPDGTCAHTFQSKVWLCADSAPFKHSCATGWGWSDVSGAAADQAAYNSAYAQLIAAFGTEDMTITDNQLTRLECPALPWPDEPPGAQRPESPALPDVEAGEVDDGGGDNGHALPKLPKVTFSPDSGPVGGFLQVTLSVPGFPSAHIRFTKGLNPANPRFGYPPDPITGEDYDGLNAPVSINAPPSILDVTILKAVAQMAGYEDSEVSSASYDSGRSNNSNAVIIHDRSGSFAQPAATYPSVKYVEGLSGNIDGITLTLYNLTHSGPGDIRIILVSPSGTKVQVMSNCGGTNTISGVDLSFPDPSGPPLPENDPIISGSYGATRYGADFSFPPPAPPLPYGSTMSAFIGENPNGAWKLYVVDDTALDDGMIANGWDLVITTA